MRRSSAESSPSSSLTERRVELFSPSLRLLQHRPRLERRDPERPCQTVAAAIEVDDAREDLEQGALSRILGVSPIAEHVPRERQHLWPEDLEDRLERGAIAVGVARHQPRQPEPLFRSQPRPCLPPLGRRRHYMSKYRYEPGFSRPISRPTVRQSLPNRTPRNDLTLRGSRSKLVHSKEHIGFVISHEPAREENLRMDILGRRLRSRAPARQFVRIRALSRIRISCLHVLDEVSVASRASSSGLFRTAPKMKAHSRRRATPCGRMRVAHEGGRGCRLRVRVERDASPRSVCCVTEQVRQR